MVLKSKRLVQSAKLLTVSLGLNAGITGEYEHYDGQQL